MGDNFRYRAFFFTLFSEDEKRRRTFLKEWHKTYPVDRKKHRRLAHVFSEFIAKMLYEPVRFKLRHDHFCFFGNGCRQLAVRFAWLTPDEMEFIVNDVFALRVALFKTRNLVETNMHFSFEDFLHDPKSAPLTQLESHSAICSFVWQREIVRDFVWMVLAQRNSFMALELIVACQTLMLENKYAKKDVFLATIHEGLQGSIKVSEILCWNLSPPTDLHPEDAYQRKQYPSSSSFSSAPVVKNVEH